jgi:hypothetical protein
VPKCFAIFDLVCAQLWKGRCRYVLPAAPDRWHASISSIAPSPLARAGLDISERVLLSPFFHSAYVTLLRCGSSELVAVGTTLQPRFVLLVWRMLFDGKTEQWQASAQVSSTCLLVSVASLCNSAAVFSRISGWLVPGERNPYARVRSCLLYLCFDQSPLIGTGIRNSPY